MTYSDSRRLLKYADYPVSIYEELVQLVTNRSDLNVKAFTDYEKESEHMPAITFRHDIDTGLCIERMPSLLDVDLYYQIESGTYIRADELEYGLSDVSEVANYYRDKGLEVGLHTVCYRKDDYFLELKREISRFEDILGFRPTSFTVHGLGSFRLDIRREFYQRVADKMTDLKMKFTDCNSKYRRYHYVIEDCHFDTKAGKRFIFEDFETLPPFFKNGKDYLVLTHPCYWI